MAAGEALDADALAAWSEGTGLDVRDGYGQTETGQITANPPGSPARPGSMGLPLPGVRVWIDDGELVIDPATVPTFFLGYLGDRRRTGRRRGAPATGCARRTTDTSPSRGAPTT